MKYALIRSGKGRQELEERGSPYEKKRKARATPSGATIKRRPKWNPMSRFALDYENTWREPRTTNNSCNRGEFSKVIVIWGNTLIGVNEKEEEERNVRTASTAAQKQDT